MIKDSGSRTEFTTGAVRDVQALEKGRCDLLPLEEASDLLPPGPAMVIDYIYRFQEGGSSYYLYSALADSNLFPDIPTMLLETAVHMAEGAEKYSENNWKLGIPLSRYIDSGVRHYLKHLRGDQDERHDRAFCWNMLCAIWTAKHKPELNDYIQRRTNNEQRQKEEP